MKRRVRKKNPCSHLAEGIRALRLRLGLDQEAMAQRLDSPIGSYLHWEDGQSEPSALALIRMLKLCPDSESLARFGLDIPPVLEK